MTVHLYVSWTDVINAGDVTRGDVERMSTVRASVDPVRKLVELTFVEDEEVDESVVFGNVDSYNAQELVEKNRLHHRQLRVAYKHIVQHRPITLIPQFLRANFNVSIHILQYFNLKSFCNFWLVYTLFIGFSNI